MLVIFFSFQGNVKLPAGTLVAIFSQEEALLIDCLEELQRKTEKELQSCWLLKECSANDELHSKVSSIIEDKYPSLLPTFIHTTFQNNNTLRFYPPIEQPCILLSLLPRDINSDIKDIHVPKVMHELLQLWHSNPNSVHKLLAHFPHLTQWLMEYCDRDVSAQRLCLHFINSSQFSV